MIIELEESQVKLKLVLSTIRIFEERKLFRIMKNQLKNFIIIIQE